MNNNSNKKVILSVIGIAILIVGVLGVSFAYFSYVRTGSSNNLITTGDLSFAFEDGDTINLTNHFPISTDAGIALTGTNNVCTFVVKGKSSGAPITYTVSAVEGDPLDGKTRFKDSEVFIHIESTSANEGITFTPTAGYDAGNAIGALPLVLGSGSVSNPDEVSRSFTVRMWVDSSVVTVGTGQTYESSDYANLYYSMKIKVEAND